MMLFSFDLMSINSKIVFKSTFLLVVIEVLVFLQHLSQVQYPLHRPGIAKQNSSNFVCVCAPY